MSKKTDLPHFDFQAIGILQSPYQQRFGIPHQPGVSQGLFGIIQLKPDADFVTALKGLETFSHLWIVFVFHSHGGKKWKPSIRPPRLGGNKKIGLFASRSPHRPNPIGISAQPELAWSILSANGIYGLISKIGVPSSKSTSLT